MTHSINDTQIKELVKNYQDAIHNQDQQKFIHLWSKTTNSCLISIATQFWGVKNIYQDFLIDTIQKHYSYIDLITDSLQINYIDDTTAVIVFEYHTKCIKRETNEDYGISGVETQLVKKEDEAWKLVHIHYSKK